MTITTPRAFAAAFAATISRPEHRVPSSARSRPWTGWFEQVMLDMAESAGLVCQNRGRRGGAAGEWLNVDHVFVKDELYSSFPLIVVEHENGPLGSQSGELPQSNTGEYIEWALWKALTVRSELAVLVAYPYERQRNAMVGVVEAMLQRWRSRFFPGSAGEMPVLLLIGWWPDNVTGFTPSGSLYQALVATAELDSVRLLAVG